MPPQIGAEDEGVVGMDGETVVEVGGAEEGEAVEARLTPDPLFDPSWPVNPDGLHRLAFQVCVMLNPCDGGLVTFKILGRRFLYYVRSGQRF